MTSDNSDSIYQGVKRNATCPCGSGKRFKHCHGKSQNDLRRTSNSSEDDASVKLFSNDDLFCSITGKYYELGQQQYLFVADESDIKIQLDTASVYLMQELEVFATYKEHFVSFSKIFQTNEVQFRRNIEKLYKQGLITKGNSVIDELNRPVEGVAPQFAGICIRTCENPTFLKRILDSLVRRTKKIGSSEKIYVFDDSSTHQARTENELIIGSLSDEVEVFYHGREWQLKFVNDLIIEFPENKKNIERLLLPQTGALFSGGRLINLALLFFAGKCFLNFDDDFILDDARIYPEYTDKCIKINSEIDWVFEGFSSREQVQKVGIPLDSDPISQHKKALGLKLSEFLNAQNQNGITSNSLSKATSSSLKHINPDSFIITSGNGWFGTHGKRNARYLFTNIYKDTKAPWKSQESYKELLNGSYCWDSMANMQVMTNGVSNPAGINNMQVLAPTLSTCQGEDTLLCLMSKLLYPNSFHLGFPWALSHFRHPKKWRNATFKESLPIQLSVLIFELSLEVKFPNNYDSSEKIKMISEKLSSNSSLPVDQFKTKLLSNWVKSNTSNINKLNKTLDSLDVNDVSCKKDIETIVKNDTNHLLAEKLPYIEDAIGDSEEEKLIWLQKELKNYADGMRVWPKLWHHCKMNKVRY